MTNRKYYIIGGIQRTDKLTREYHRYKKGIIFEYDPITQNTSLVFEHVTAPEHCAWDDDPSILFKSSHLEGNRLYLCTQTEVLIVSVPEFEILHHISHPYMNDVHHVRPSKNGTLIVTSTGLDAVFEYSFDGELLTEWNVLERSIWERFSRDVDYRKVVTTKPHDSHPNFSFYLDDELWVTRLVQQDAICLNSPGKRIDIAVERPHDGVVHNGKIYFTTVDGHVVVFEQASRELYRNYDLNQYSGKYCALGWCRGINIVDEDRAIIAFSRLRKTKWEQNVQWVKYSLSLTKDKPEEPTRIAQYHLTDGKLEWEIDLEPWGVGEIFSVIDVPE